MSGETKDFIKTIKENAGSLSITAARALLVQDYAKVKEQLVDACGDEFKQLQGQARKLRDLIGIFSPRIEQEKDAPTDSYTY